MFAAPLAGKKLPSAKLLLAAGGTLLAAATFALAIAAQPLVGLAVPALALCGVLCARRPAAAVITLLVLSSSYGSIKAFLGFSAGPLVDLITAGLLLAVAGSYLINRRARSFSLWPSAALVGAYLVLTFFEIFAASKLNVGLLAFRYSAWYMLLFLLVGYAGWRYATYERIAKALIVVAALVGAYATLRWIVGPSGAERTNALSSNGVYNFVGDKLQVFGSFSSRRELGFWVATMIPFCMAFFFGFGGRWRALSVVAIGLCSAALLGSHLRAGIPAVVIGFVLVLCLYQLSRAFPGRRLGTTAVVLLLAATIGGSLYVATVGSGEQSSASPYSAIFNPGSDASYRERTRKWTAAMHDINRHPFGSGLGTAGLTQERGKTDYLNIASFNLESTYLEIAYQQGLFVMGFFAVALLSLLIALARRGISVIEPRRASLAAGAAGALAAAMTMFLSGEFLAGALPACLWLAIGVAIGALETAPRHIPSPSRTEMPAAAPLVPSTPG